MTQGTQGVINQKLGIYGGGEHAESVNKNIGVHIGEGETQGDQTKTNLACTQQTKIEEKRKEQTKETKSKMKN